MGGDVGARREAEAKRESNGDELVAAAAEAVGAIN